MSEQKLSLPLVRWLTSDTYERPDEGYTVSELIQLPQQAILGKRHWEKIEIPLSSRVAGRIGDAVHKGIAEHAYSDPDSTFLSEQRFHGIFGGFKISGQIDLFEITSGGRLIDYKTTSTWVHEYDGKGEWEAQTNCYAELLRMNGYTINSLAIEAIYKDWSPLRYEFARMRRDSVYPSEAVNVFEIPMWTSKKVHDFVIDKVTKLEAAKKEDDAHLPECTVEERWRKDQWAVMKKGGKRAKTLHDSEKKADEQAAELGAAFYVEHRPGIALRCKSYFCSSAPFCQQLKREAGEEDEF